MFVFRRSLLKAAAAAPFAILSSRAWAQAYPSKSVRVLVPAGAGTGIDLVTRYFTDKLGEELGKPFVPENRPGAGGLIGYSQAAKSPPDGYTLILTGIPLYLLPLFADSAQPSYDPRVDFVPIARVVRVPQAIVVSADSRFHSINDLLKAMQQTPGEVTYSSQGVGSSAHLCAVVLNEMTKTRAKHIPYKESGMALTDVVAGRVDFTCQSSAGMLPLIQGGKLRVLGVTNANRWKLLPDTPTVEEAGVGGFEVSSQLDFMAPKGTPVEVLQTLSQALEKIARDPKFEEFCYSRAMEPEFLGYQALRAEVDKEAARWKKIVELSRK
ncbi:Bug family tripartite tricarboxylate transporter substrate binding protein [Achromobacter spanius]|uniref:Bug family tripartite tricarboxylate transporter substrate binding protein n=1 Tax=Achromobacter spanius TaxID=217203 RepID=UPI0036E6D3ED